MQATRLLTLLFMEQCKGLAVSGAMQAKETDGYRPNVGIILTNHESKLLWARRIGQNAWQFPQGGIHSAETPEQAMYRELEEEVGLGVGDVRILGHTQGWLHYDLPAHLVRRERTPFYVGQKQVWFMLRLLADDARVCLDLSSKPEFDRWRWVDYWAPLTEVIQFKREVYTQALRELEPLLLQEPRTLQPVSTQR
jgi:putative (di)nucleoside polyphosphate hydrolase